MNEADSAERIILALDLPDELSAEKMVECIGPKLKFVKVGPVLYGRGGQTFLRRLAKRDLRLFLDLKFHDIPNTVAGAVLSFCGEGTISFFTLHASGGGEMIAAAREAVDRLPTNSRPKILAVTILTSLEREALERMGFLAAPVRDHVLRLANLAINSGADGVVCSAEEVADVRKSVPPGSLIVVPGIRLDSERDDQKRRGTPQAAIRSGATHLVVGRPVLEAKDPQKVFEQLVAAID